MCPQHHGSGGVQGQRCTAVKVVMVHEAVADELVAQVHARVKALTVGKPEDNCDICAVISEGSANWIEELVAGARRRRCPRPVCMHACLADNSAP